MCGIVGLFLKQKALEPSLGEWLEPMLVAMAERGPDSAGFAIYHDPAPEGALKLTLYHPETGFDWEAVAEGLGTAFAGRVDLQVRGDPCRDRGVGRGIRSAHVARSAPPRRAHHQRRRGD